MGQLNLLYCVICWLGILSVQAKISDKRLCGDETCTVPLSTGVTLLPYNADDIRILSFKPNVPVTIYSKSAGSRTDLWGAEINGKRGYVPVGMLRENKIFIESPAHLVDTEETLQTVPPVPDPVVKAYEVVDGTTIYVHTVEIQPSTTVDTQSTATKVIPPLDSGREAEATTVTSSDEDDNVEDEEEEVSDEDYEDDDDEVQLEVSTEATTTVDSSMVAAVEDKSAEEATPQDNIVSTPPSDVPPVTQEYVPQTVLLPEELTGNATLEHVSTTGQLHMEDNDAEVLDKPTESPEFISSEQQEPLAMLQETTTFAPLLEEVTSHSFYTNPRYLSDARVTEEPTPLIEEPTPSVETPTPLVEEPTESPSPPPADETPADKANGLFDGIYSSIFGSGENQTAAQDIENDVDQIPEDVNVTERISDELEQQIVEEQRTNVGKDVEADGLRSENAFAEVVEMQQSCAADSDCPKNEIFSHNNRVEDVEESNAWSTMDVPSNTFDILLYLIVTATTILIFSLGHYYIDRKRQEGPLIAKINDLQKTLLVVSKENQLLQENTNLSRNYIVEDDAKLKIIDTLTTELEYTKLARIELEEQVSSLERELETATETGLELNKMLTDFLSSQNESDSMMANVEKLQRQLVEQQGTISSLNKTVNIKEQENDRLVREIETIKAKTSVTQTEMDQMVLNFVKLQEEKMRSENERDTDIAGLQQKLIQLTKSSEKDVRKLNDNLKRVQKKLEESQRSLDVKTNEFKILQDNFKEVTSIENNTETLQNLLDVSKTKAELLQLRREKQNLNERVQKEQEGKRAFEQQTQVAIQELQLLKDKYEESDKEKTEAQTRLEVLSTYFKEKEAELQKELNEQQSMWVLKQGEANSTVERIKWMQEELQNCKQQNESLKKEVLAQEVELKSQISVLEKRAHESWVSARQAERKLDDARQEAAQLRNRLTLLMTNEDKHSRLLSPMEQNGDIATTALHLDNAASPPLLFPGPDHMSLPPFMPPLPGVPFLPPPLGGVPPFMPPPSSMFPGDHRPPPLGRMSSPPLHARFSPDSRTYSPYDRDTPSPSYDDEDYDRRTPPPGHRGYSPYGTRQHRDYRHTAGPPPPLPHRNMLRNHKGSTISSGSGNSNDSLDKPSRQSNNV